MPAMLYAITAKLKILWSMRFEYAVTLQLTYVATDGFCIRNKSDYSSTSGTHLSSMRRSVPATH